MPAKKILTVPVDLAEGNSFTPQLRLALKNILEQTKAHNNTKAYRALSILSEYRSHSNQWMSLPLMVGGIIHIIAGTLFSCLIMISSDTLLNLYFSSIFGAMLSVVLNSCILQTTPDPFANYIDEFEKIVGHALLFTPVKKETPNILMHLYTEKKRTQPSVFVIDDIKAAFKKALPNEGTVTLNPMVIAQLDFLETYRWGFLIFNILATLLRIAIFLFDIKTAIAYNLTTWWLLNLASMTYLVPFFCDTRPDAIQASHIKTQAKHSTAFLFHSDNKTAWEDTKIELQRKDDPNFPTFQSMEDFIIEQAQAEAEAQPL